MSAVETTTPRIVGVIRIIRRPGLSVNQLDALIGISLQDTASPSDIVKRLNCSGSAVTQILDVLERRRYITRRYAAGVGDRRRSMLAITEAGRLLIESLETQLETPQS